MLGACCDCCKGAWPVASDAPKILVFCYTQVLTAEQHPTIFATLHTTAEPSSGPKALTAVEGLFKDISVFSSVELEQDGASVYSISTSRSSKARAHGRAQPERHLQLSNSQIAVDPFAARTRRPSKLDSSSTPCTTRLSPSARGAFGPRACSSLRFCGGPASAHQLGGWPQRPWSSSSGA